MFFLSSLIVSSFGPGMQNQNGLGNNADIKDIAISHEKPLNFDTAARLYFVAEGGLESSHDAQTAGLIRFASRSILPGVAVPPMAANRCGFPPSQCLNREGMVTPSTTGQASKSLPVCKFQLPRQLRIAAAEDSFRQTFLLKQRRRTGIFYRTSSKRREPSHGRCRPTR